MRGKALHNYMASEIKAACDQLSVRSELEYAIRFDDVKVYFDIALWVKESFLVCEVETTLRNVIHNVQKAYAFGAELWIVVPTRKLRRQVANKLRRVELKPAGQEINLLLLNQFKQALTNKLLLSIAANRVAG